MTGDTGPEAPAAPFAGALVRPYALTRGRTRPRVDLAVETLIRTTDRGRSIAPEVGALERQVLELAESPVAVAEVAARLGMVIGAARVIVGDLVATGWVDRSDAVRPTETDGSDPTDPASPSSASSPGAAGGAGSAPHEDRSLLERVLDGLNAL